MPDQVLDVTEYDPWLDRWAKLLKRVGDVALDVGCGPGYDTQVLASWGLIVTASDVSLEAINRSQQRNPGVKHVLADARTLEPFSDGTFDLVVACLSLHYFDQVDSHHAFGAVHRVLRDGGLFAFRVNSWDDYEFGAPVNGSLWDVTLHKGRQKQFFTKEKIREVLDGRFEILSMERCVTYRYVKRKVLLEYIARKLSRVIPGSTP